MKVKYKVTGGTHLGIVSCYGEKTFEVDVEPSLPIALVNALRKDVGIPEDAKLDYYRHGPYDITWCFVDKNNNTLFEFYYEQENVCQQA